MLWRNPNSSSLQLPTQIENLMDTDITPFDWHRLLLGSAPPVYLLEIVVRVLMLFAILIILVRVLGKRGQKDLSPMQQMLMIALGSAAGDVMLYPQLSIAYAGTVLVGVTLLTISIEMTASRVRAVRNYLESEPRVLVKNGAIDFNALKKERTTERELFASLRCGGAVALSQVELAVLEVTGSISVVLNDSKPNKRDLIEYLLNGETRPAYQGLNG